MKISLEEARKRATQALLYEHTCPDTGRQFLCAAGIDNDVAEVFDHVGMPRANSALLAHCWNTHDELVAALEAVVTDLDLLSNCPGGSSELQHMVETALIKAKTVEMP